MCLCLAFPAYYQFIHSGHVYCSTRVLRSAALVSCLWSALPVSWIFFSKVSSSFLFQFFSGNFASILRESCSLNWYKFLNNALSSSLNGMLHYFHFGTVLAAVLKLVFTIVSSAFVYKHRKKISRKMFQKISFCICISSDCKIFENLYFTR